MPYYTPAIGLEIHIELSTQTKMFCGCRNDSDEEKPNVNICPVCLAHPGTLPVPNKEAVVRTVKLGLAIGGTVAETSRFDRKSYFYPDLPKGYQISQYENPLVKGGTLCGVRIRRIHLEEDTGKLVHQVEDKKAATLVDFNRAGVPLVELVTEPDIRNGEEAAAFAKELQLILRYLGISGADMEKGEMRIEANVSISEDTERLGTKVEVKNLNSFKAVQEAVQYEISREKEVLESGETVAQETRGWSDTEKKTKSQRTKEEAHDYRYFPEPDIPPLDLRDTRFIDIEILRAELPELPEEKRRRLMSEYGLSEKQAALLAEDTEITRFFEEAASELDEEISKKGDYRMLYNYLTTDLYGLLKEARIEWSEMKITPENFADLTALTMKGEITSRMAKDILIEMISIGEDPKAIIERRGMRQIVDEGVIEKAARETITQNKKAVEDYKNGKESALQFLIGKTMAELKGQGNPAKIKEILTKEIG